MLRLRCRSVRSWRGAGESVAFRRSTEGREPVGDWSCQPPVESETRRRKHPKRRSRPSSPSATEGLLPCRCIASRKRRCCALLAPCQGTEAAAAVYDFRANCLIIEPKGACFSTHQHVQPRTHQSVGRHLQLFPRVFALHQKRHREVVQSRGRARSSVAPGRSSLTPAWVYPICAPNPPSDWACAQDSGNKKQPNRSTTTETCMQRCIGKRQERYDAMTARSCRKGR